MRNTVRKFSYNGCNISFNMGKGGDDVMVNATQMAKPFNKRPAKWLELPSTKAYLDSLSAIRKMDRSTLIKNLNGVGTWLHEDVAIEFARWLNPEFSIWCNDRIKELFKLGATAIEPDNLLDPDYIIRIATALKEERKAKTILKEQLLQQKEILALQEQIIESQSTKVQYVDNVLKSNGLFAITVIAQHLNMSATKLNRILADAGIQYPLKKAGIQYPLNYSRGRTWVLQVKYLGKDLAHHKTFIYTDNHGQIQTSRHLYWTEKGAKFIIDLFNDNPELLL